MNKAGKVSVRRATAQDIGAVAGLFDLYRMFYNRPSDLQTCHRFIQARISASESTIFLALDEEDATPLGFTQLYPTFCSVEASRIFVLYDLFVVDTARGRGVGLTLMESAEHFARSEGAGRIDLETHHSNQRAQRLYESLGYTRDQEFYKYSLELKR